MATSHRQRRRAPSARCSALTGAGCGADRQNRDTRRRGSAVDRRDIGGHRRAGRYDVVDDHDV